MSDSWRPQGPQPTRLRHPWEQYINTLLSLLYTHVQTQKKSENIDIKLLAMLLLTSLSGSLESSCIR